MSSEMEMIIRKELLKLGLSENDVSLYLNILGKGPLTIGEISMLTELPFDVIDKSLSNLVRHELARKIEGTPPRFEALPPLKLFAKGFEHVLEIFKGLDKTLSDALEKNISKLDETARNTLETHFEALKSELFKSIDKIVDDLKGKVTDVVYSSIMKEFEDVKKDINTINSTINAIYETLIRAEKAAPKEVWIVKGIESIFAHMKDAIARAKINVRIVVPELSQVPLEEIEKLPSNVRLFVVAKYDPSKPEHREVLSKLSKRKFTMIRHSERMNMIGIIVDEKEVLFAPYSENNPENTYGVAAVQDDMVFALKDFLMHAWTTARDISP